MTLATALRIAFLIVMFLIPKAFAQATAIADDLFYEGAKRSPELKSLEGKPATEIDASAWIGDSVKIADLKGKIVVLDFWATWCGPCMAAIPENVQLVEEMKNKPFAFVGIHDSQNGWNQAAKVVKDKKINYPVAKDSGSSAKNYKLQFWPTYVVIDHKGIVRAAGLIPSNVKQVVELLLKDVPATASNSTSANPDEWYVSPAQRRTAWLREVEGKPVPKLGQSGWIGEPIADDALQGKIAVISLLGAGGDLSVNHCRELQSAHQQFSAAGVKFIGLYRSGAKSEDIKSLFDQEKFEFRPAVDVPAVATGEIDPAKWHGAFAAELGIRIWPMVLIVDRTGKIRVAGAHPARIADVLTSLLAEPAPESSLKVDELPQVQRKDEK